MARKPMVTRTIQSTNVNVLCLNVVDGEPCNISVALPRTYKDEEAMLKEAKKHIDTDTVKAVHIVDVEVTENLYGMDEADFIKYAHPITKRGEEEDGINE